MQIFNQSGGGGGDIYWGARWGRSLNLHCSHCLLRIASIFSLLIVFFIFNVFFVFLFYFYFFLMNWQILLSSTLNIKHRRIILNWVIFISLLFWPLFCFDDFSVFKLLPLSPPTHPLLGLGLHTLLSQIAPSRCGHFLG